MGKTLVRASHRKYKKSAKGYTKRKIIIKKSRHTRNRRGGELTKEQIQKAHDLKEYIKVQLGSLLKNKSDPMSKFVNEDNQKAYMEAFGDIFEIWSKFTAEQKEYFKEHFLKVGFGHGNRIPVYQSILADLEIHELCKDDKNPYDCFNESNAKHDMISNLGNKFKYAPGNTDSTSVVSKEENTKHLKSTKADEAFELLQVARRLRENANSLLAAFKNAEAAYNNADSEASIAEKSAQEAHSQVPLDI